MKTMTGLLAALVASSLMASATVTIDEDAFGNSLGGWKKRGKQAAEYVLSGTTYRTYKPEITPTPDGGIFASVRIDHVRGWLSSDDHAILEVTISDKGMIVSAQSNIAIQGRSISSDVILGSSDAGRQLVGTERAVQIGTDLVADLSAKLLREKVVEAGRVSFPSALRHNYNLLFQALRVHGLAPGETAPVATPIDPPPASPDPPAASTAPATPTPADEDPKGQEPAPSTPPTEPAPPADPKPPADLEPANKPLEIKPYATPKTADLPVQS